LFKNGNVLSANKPELLKLSFRGNTKFLQAIPSQKMTRDIDFSGGTAEFFVPIIDTKDRLVSVLYVRKNIDQATKKVRADRQSAGGVNMIIDTSGSVLLSTEKAKEGVESVAGLADIKPVLEDDGTSEGIKEGNYAGKKGLFGYKKSSSTGLIACVFTPYDDYAFMKKKTKQIESSFMDIKFIIPVYGIIAFAFIIGLALLLYSVSLPFTPLNRIVKALTRIDEESFQDMLPKERSGDYRKLIDSLIILKGRIKAAEEKSYKLSQMSKELEEELSREASRADAEISQVRDALKIAENTKASLEEKLQKITEQTESEKKALQKRAETEKAVLEQKISVLQKETEQLRQEAKKSSDVKVPFEKENMRMDSVLMMNTELKGVLSVIKTYISSVLGGEGKITDAQQQFLGVVINKSARLERLINDLTELAKLEKGDIKAVSQPVEINNIIQDIVFAIQPQADIKKVELKVNFSPSLPTAFGDPARLSNVINQILNQSIKVSPRGGQVIVETREAGDDVQVRISDFGMSMPQAKAAALFINFHGPESVAGPEFVNTGLRFPILKAVVNSMAGEIWVESEIGKGKTFVISLPKKQGSRASKQESRPGLESKPEIQIKPAAETVKPDFSAAAPAAPAQIKPAEKQPEKAVPTVTDILNLDVPVVEKKREMPGSSVKVPEELLKTQTQPKKEQPLPPLPDELPPLPDLEDDKGSDIIK
ncbi:MAG TPA: ATP-binding protein, partial [Candidatus Goldiibacteriota bacterium]|nr:ATP-binding protein [Candidatus Goldiibacteriota bacterium]